MTVDNHLRNLLGVPGLEWKTELKVEGVEYPLLGSLTG